MVPISYLEKAAAELGSLNILRREVIVIAAYGRLPTLVCAMGGKRLQWLRPSRQFSSDFVCILIIPGLYIAHRRYKKELVRCLP